MIGYVKKISKASKEIRPKTLWRSNQSGPTGRKESRKTTCDDMYLSPRYLVNIENKGQHPSLQVFLELMLRFDVSVDQFLFPEPKGKSTQRRQLDAMLDGLSEDGIRIVTATVREIAQIEQAKQHKTEGA